MIGIWRSAQTQWLLLGEKQWKTSRQLRSDKRPSMTKSDVEIKPSTRPEAWLGEKLPQAFSKGSKMEPNWIGPWRVHEVLSKGTYRLSQEGDPTKSLTQLYNKTLLKLYYRWDTDTGGRDEVNKDRNTSCHDVAVKQQSILAKNNKGSDEVKKDGSTSCHYVAVKEQSTLVKNDKGRDEVNKDGNTACHDIAVKQQSTLVKNTTDYVPCHCCKSRCSARKSCPCKKKSKFCTVDCYPGHSCVKRHTTSYWFVRHEDHNSWNSCTPSMEVHRMDHLVRMQEGNSHHTWWVAGW